MATHAPIHLGEILREDFLRPLGLSEYRIAKPSFATSTAVPEPILSRARSSASSACSCSNSSSISTLHIILSP